MLRVHEDTATFGQDSLVSQASTFAKGDTFAKIVNVAKGFLQKDRTDAVIAPPPATRSPATLAPTMATDWKVILPVAVGILGLGVAIWALTRKR